LSSRLTGGLRGFARQGKDGARETIKYYSGSGRDERRFIKASFFIGVSTAVLWYILALYWSALGFSSQEMGWMFAIGSATSGITLIFSGYLADKFGRKGLALMGLLGTTAGTAMYIADKNFLLFAGINALISFSGSLTWPSMMALFASKAEPSRLKYLFGLQSFTNEVGQTIGTFAGIAAPGLLPFVLDIDDVGSFRLVFLVGAIISAIPILYVLKVSEPERHSEKLMLEFDKPTRRMLYAWCAQSAFIGLGAALVMPWISIIFTEGMGATYWEVNLMILLSNIVLAAGFFIVPFFAESRSPVKIIAACQMASIIFMVMIPYSTGLAMAAVLYATRSFFMLVPSPLVNGYVMNIVSERIRASFVGLGQLAWTVAFMCSEAFSGYLWNGDYTKTEPFLYCGALYVVGTLVFYFYFKNIKEKHEETGSVTVR
jgi:MFS family permease